MSETLSPVLPSPGAVVPQPDEQTATGVAPASGETKTALRVPISSLKSALDIGSASIPASA